MAASVEFKDIVQIGTLLGTFCTLVFGVLQYRTAQRWRKKELIAGEAKAFFDDPMVQKALNLMEWSGLRLELAPPEPGKPAEIIWVTPELVASSLKMRSEGPLTGDSFHAKTIDNEKVEFSPAQVHIRDAFDRLLDGLERFESHVASGLVDVSDVAPYLSYWFGLMSGKDNTKMGKVARNALAAYLLPNGYGGAKRLMERCGYHMEVAT